MINHNLKRRKKITKKALFHVKKLFFTFENPLFIKTVFSKQTKNFCSFKYYHQFKQVFLNLKPNNKNEKEIFKEKISLERGFKGYKIMINLITFCNIKNKFLFIYLFIHMKMKSVI